jgi:uncharacterized membrane protein YphA (DoxX/SURF4 family)
MKLEPYLKHMLKLKADCLILQANKVPALRLLNQKKTVGNKILTTEFINEFIDDLLDDTQKQALANYKTVRLGYTHLNKYFIVRVKKTIDIYTVQISPDKRSSKLINSTKHPANPKVNQNKQLETGVALLRITLGIITLASWYENLNSGLYTADGLTNFFNWLFDAENGNGSSLIFYKTFLDATVVPIVSIFVIFQLVAELVLGLGMLLGLLTRFFSLAGMILFLNIFLSRFGGHEWIWGIVLMFMAFLVVFLGYAGRKWGVDALLLKLCGAPRYPILW